MKKVLIVVLLIFAVGCQKKYVKAPEEPVQPEVTVKEEVVVEPEVEKEVVEEIVVAKEEEIMETVLSPEEEAKSIFKDVLFDFDKYNIRPDARPILDSVASFLNNNQKLNIIVEGHCDERGTNEYNLALGERRAKSTKKYLISMGVSPARMSAITYGEEKPLCTWQDESCWQRNRRAHFIIAK